MKREITALTTQVKRFLGNYVRAEVLKRQYILPYFALLYVTYRCNSNCGFCSRAKQVRVGADEMNIRETWEILSQIRKITPALYITGGEPLVVSNLEERLEIAKKLDFYPIIMNTNATLLDKHWGVLSRVDELVVSLHTTDAAELARIYGTKLSLADRALCNIAEATERARKPGSVRIMANCVLTAENISSADLVLEYCLRQNIRLAVVPAIIGQRPLIAMAPPELQAAYRRFLKRVIRQKKIRPESVQGTLGYLEHIRDLKPVDCRPEGMLPISPNGRVINACDAMYEPLAQRASILATLQNAHDYSASFRPCPHNCLKACYTQPAVSLARPMEAIREYLAGG